MADAHFDADGGGSASMTFPFSVPDLRSLPDDVQVFPTTSPISGNDFLSALSNIATSAAKGAQLYYGTQAQIQAAKNNADIIAASGANAVQAARSGLPSPTLLMVGGFGLAALLLLTSKK